MTGNLNLRNEAPAKSKCFTVSWDVPLKLVPKSSSWYNNDPLFNAEPGINMGHIYKIF